MLIPRSVLELRRTFCLDTFYHMILIFESILPSALKCLSTPVFSPAQMCSLSLA